MSKFITIASLAVAAIGFSTISGGAAFAAGCLNTGNLPPLTLSHNDLAPNQRSSNDQAAYNAQLAKGNACGTTEQSFSISDNVSHPNEAHASSSGSNR